jgi:hypothetical protein
MKKILLLGIGVWSLAAFSQPNRLRAIFKGDPAREVTIAWSAREGRASEPSYLLYDTLDRGLDLGAYRNRVEATLEQNHKGMNNVFVEVSGLNPDTEYFFVPVENGIAGKRYSVRTLAEGPNARLSFVVGGDSRNNQSIRRKGNLLLAKLRAHFVFFTGDMTGGDGSSEVQQWLDDWQLTHGPDGRVTPLVIARGNHEISNDSISKIFGTTSEVYYSVGFGGDLLRIFVLNTEISKGGTQGEWLAKELQAHQNARWKIAGYHRPMRPHSTSKGNGDSQYQNWAPLFWQHRVAMVFESDTHVAKATQPLKPDTKGSGGFVVDPQGSVYLGEGGWGAPLREADRSYDWTLGAARLNHFQWVWLDSGNAEVRTVLLDNAETVASLDDSDRFRLPAGLALWKMGGDDVLEVPAR